MLEYLLKSVGGTYNYMALVKLAFFADRYHVRNYARPISFDEYFAMKLGTVPSNLLNCILLENYEGKNIRLVKSKQVTLVKQKVDLNEFSQTDIEALDFSLHFFAQIGKKNQFNLANLTHAYPEWERYKERFEKDAAGREEIFYEDFLKNANPKHEEFKRLGISDPFSPLTDSERKSILEEMKEYCANL